MEKGDLNLDGKITFEDVLLLYNYVNNIPGYSIPNFYIADINNDGKITFDDVLLLYNVVNNVPGFNIIQNKVFEYNNFIFNYEVGPKWFNDEIQTYTEESVEITEDNILKVKLTNENNKIYSGRIVTNYSDERLTIRKGEKIKLKITAKMPECYLNGVEVLPESTDIWPALWLMGEELSGGISQDRKTYWSGYVNWPICAEIDLLEFVPSWFSQNTNSSENNTNRVFHAVHIPGRSGGNPLNNSFNGIDVNFDLHKGFYTYSLEIYKGINDEDSYLEFFFENQSTWRINYKYEYRQIWATMNANNEIADNEIKIYGLLINIAYSGAFTSNQDRDATKISNATLEISDISVEKISLSDENFFFKLNIENIKILNEYSNPKSILLKFSSDQIELNSYNNRVYDFVNWAKIHLGGSSNIEKFGNDNNNYTLNYPSWHSKERFIDNLINYDFIGIFDNVLNYYDLPTKFKNDNIKRNLIKYE
jgi:hypothetical protein